MDTPDGEDGFPNPNDELSVWEYCIAWFPPPGFRHCGIYGCNDPSEASWIEQNVNDESFVIVPVCAWHAHFAAETLDDIKCLVGIGDGE